MNKFITEKLNILGITLTLASRDSIKKSLISACENSGQVFLTTPNPEIILRANQDEELHYIINKSNLAIPDGIGLKFAGWLMGHNLTRWVGSDITLWLLKQAEAKQLKVAVLNWSGGLSSKTDIETALRKDYPGLSFLVESIDKEWSLPFYQSLNIFRPDILFVALGSPYQEKFLYHNLPKMPYVKVGMGIGGSFDYITGKIKPAPKLIKNLGLEWLWRLLNISSFSFPLKRIKRILTAVVVFPLKFIKWRYINPCFYRKNVACFLYKKQEQKYQVLILKNIGLDEHWQIPQGGRDGESLNKAGTRELQEEIGTFRFTPKAAIKNLHKYIFPIDSYKYRNYKGQSQGLLIAEFIGSDSDIKLNFWEYDAWQWVDLEKLLETVHPVRQKSMKIFIEKFQENIINKNLNK